MALYAEKRIIIVATNRELAGEHYYKRLWIAIRNLSEEFSRRKWVDCCIGYFRDMDGAVEFQWPNGTPYLPPDWDNLFSDADARWLSFYLEEFNGSPKMRSNLYSRLRVFDAVIRAKWPNIAKRIQE